MPLALLLVVVATFLLYKRAEKRLKVSVEEQEFQTKDRFMFAGVAGVVLSVLALAFFLNPSSIVGNVLTALFLGSYTMLLFNLTYLFSDLKKRQVQLLSVGFGIVSLVAGCVSFLEPLQDAYTLFRAGAFFGLALLCFVVAAYEQKQSDVKAVRWTLAVQPAALFLLFFVCFNLLHVDGTLNVWFPYMLDAFGGVFAVLLILYISPMFNWKNVCIFAIILTLLDIVLVFSGPMVIAAETFTGLGLPMVIYLPNVPFILNAAGEAALRGLGLGDFFFAGVLAIQTFNRFGKKYAYASIGLMVVSFAIWEIFLMDLLAFFNLRGFPATVFIITGWIPIAIIATLKHKKQKETQKPSV
jgi:hypothetical protein